MCAHNTIPPRPFSTSLVILALTRNICLSKNTMLVASKTSKRWKLLIYWFGIFTRLLDANKATNKFICIRIGCLLFLHCVFCFRLLDRDGMISVRLNEWNYKRYFTIARKIFLICHNANMFIWELKVNEHLIPIIF